MNIQEYMIRQSLGSHLISQLPKILFVSLISGIVLIMAVTISFNDENSISAQAVISKSDYSELTKSKAKIDKECTKLFPKGFDPDNINKFTKGCFPASHLTIKQCETKKQWWSSPSVMKKCLADGFFEKKLGQPYTGGTGTGFHKIWCDMGNKWAQCKSNNGFSSSFGSKL